MNTSHSPSVIIALHSKAKDDMDDLKNNSEEHESEDTPLDNKVDGILDRVEGAKDEGERNSALDELITYLEDMKKEPFEKEDADEDAGEDEDEDETGDDE